MSPDKNKHSENEPQNEEVQVNTLLDLGYKGKGIKNLLTLSHQNLDTALSSAGVRHVHSMIGKGTQAIASNKRNKLIRTSGS